VIYGGGQAIYEDTTKAHVCVNQPASENDDFLFRDGPLMRPVLEKGRRHGEVKTW
jgi:hypothetical protein